MAQENYRVHRRTLRHDRMPRRAVFVFTLVFYLFAMFPELLPLLRENKSWMLKAILVISAVVIILKRIRMTFFNWLVSKWFFFTYFVLGVIEFVVILIVVNTATWGQSLLLTISLMTGADPFSLKDELQPNLFTWIVAWVIHVGAYLFIPALIAVVIGDAKANINRERSLKDGLNQVAREMKIKKEKIPKVTDMLLGEVEKWLRELKEKGSE